MTSLPPPPPKPPKKPMSTRAVVLVVVAALCVTLAPALLGLWGAWYGYRTARRHAVTEAEGLALLRSLDEGDLKQLSLATEVGDPVVVVTNRSNLAAFTQAAHGVEHYRPNHPQYEQTFYVDMLLADGQERTYEFRTMSAPEGMLYITFVQRKAIGVHYLGDAKSRDLYAWLRDMKLLD